MSFVRHTDTHDDPFCLGFNSALWKMLVLVCMCVIRIYIYIHTHFFSSVNVNLPELQVVYITVYINIQIDFSPRHVMADLGALHFALEDLGLDVLRN